MVRVTFETKTDLDTLISFNKIVQTEGEDFDQYLQTLMKDHIKDYNGID